MSRQLSFRTIRYCLVDYALDPRGDIVRQSDNLATLLRFARRYRAANMDACVLAIYDRYNKQETKIEEVGLNGQQTIQF